MASLLSYALTNVSDVKENLGIASSNHDYDNLITRKINQATLAIENYTGRHFAKTTYTDEEYDATKTNQLILRQRPLIVDDDNPFSIGYRNTSLNDDDWTTSETNLYFTDTNSGVVDLDFVASGQWNRFRVSYTAGYETIPEDLAEAAATLATYYFNNADGTSVDVLEKQEGQRRIRYSHGSVPTSFATIIAGLGIDQILNGYSNYPLLADK